MEFTLKIEKEKSCEVLVVGAGPAGVAAAIAAARQGVKVMLVESLGRVGGISTSGMMSHFTGSVGNKIYHEILMRAAEKNAFAPGEITTKIDPENLTLTYLEMLAESHVELLLYTTFCEAVMDADQITGAIFHSKDGFTLVRAKVVIDATGDGDVAYKCGAEYVLGREEDGKMQPATLMFKIGGVDEERAVFPPSFETLVPTKKGELQALARKLLPHPAGHVLLYRSTIPGIVTVNMTNVTDIDGTCAEDLTRAECISRAQIPEILRFLRAYAPGYESCYLVGTASLIGVRETRHFLGEKTLVRDDIADAVQYDDFVVYDAHFNFDVHNITGAGLDKTGCQHKFTQTKGYTIPYGCLVPKTIDGLLLAGRCISGTHMAHSSYRAMPICIGMGEGAGVGAALAVKKSIPPRKVLPKEIQKLIL